MTLPMDDKTAPSETPLTENLQKLADDISVKCGVATVQAAIRIYLRQLAPHAREREGGVLLEKSLEQMERYLTALAESRAEADKQRQIAANWQNMEAMHRSERDEARTECERLRSALQLVMRYPEIRKYLGSDVSNVADAALSGERRDEI